MTEALERKLSRDELKNLTQTIELGKTPTSETTVDRRPKVRYVATDDVSVLKIMGGVVYALQQRDLHDEADELRKLILGGAYGDPAEALELIGTYVRLKIVDQEGLEVGSLG